MLLKSSSKVGYLRFGKVMLKLFFVIFAFEKEVTFELL
jgi:hypothetical protein